MATIKVVLRKKKNKDGSYPLAIRITCAGKSSYIYFSQNIKETEWDAINHRVRKTHPNATRLNNFLLKKLSEANDRFLQIQTDQGVVLPKVVKSALRPSNRGSSFNFISKSYLDNFLKAGKYNRFYSEQSRINNFMDFLDTKDIAFQEITISLINRFKSHLKSKNASDRSVVNHLIVLRTLFNIAIKSDVITQDHYPFGKGKVAIKLPESIKIGLTVPEVKKIEDISLDSNSYMEHAKNLWLFSFYLAGMRISDVLRLKWSDVKDSRITYNMGKNSKSVSLKLSEKSINILNKYKSKDTFKDDFIFPELISIDPDNTFEIQRKISYAVKRIDKHLNKLREKIKLDKKLTMHIARHTFGNISGDKISIQMLQKLYRHSSITTTIGYQANFIHKDTDEALDAVIDF